MALAYRIILRTAGRKINAIVGTTKTTLESAYTTSPLTVTQIGNVNFTLSMIYDLLVSTVGTIVRAYASVPDHPYRAYNISQTSNITNRSPLPSANSASQPIVGAYGAIRDASSGKLLTKQPAQLIESIILGVADGSIKGTYYHYDIAEGRLIHTVTNAVIDVCTFNVATELASVAANGNAPIPDALFDLAWTGLVASLVIDDEFASQAAVYGQYFQSGIEMLKAGGTPAPLLTSSAEPIGS